MNKHLSCGEKTGTVSKKKFKREQLMPISDEFEELTVQHFKNADSWNSYHVSNATEVVKEVLRERRIIGTDGYLEALCVLHKKVKPEWKAVTSVADTRAYMFFQQHKVRIILLILYTRYFISELSVIKDYHEEIRQQNRAKETENDRFEVERIFTKKGPNVFVLWTNFDQPSWEPVKDIQHLRIYKRWRANLDKEEESEQDSGEDESETGESEDKDCDKEEDETGESEDDESVDKESEDYLSAEESDKVDEKELSNSEVVEERKLGKEDKKKKK
jgi:hypothetical protein